MGTAGRTIVSYAFQESLRKRVFAVVLALTAVFLALFALGAHFAFDSVADFAQPGTDAYLDEQELTGGTIFGLAMFAVLFLGSVLAIFLTNGLVRGDAEQGLLQPLVVRPIGRGTMLVSRYLGAAAASTAYVLAVYAVAVIVTEATGGWTPDHVIAAGLSLALAVAVVAALSVLVSVFLASSAQGIAVFMIFGAGLVAGLLGQIGDALSSRSLERISDVAATALPFEATYQHALHLITADASGLTRTVIGLGPFGGADEAGIGLVAFTLAYIAGVMALAVAAFARRDL